MAIKSFQGRGFQYSETISYYRGYLARKFFFDLKFFLPNRIQTCWFVPQDSENPSDPDIWRFILFCSLARSRKFSNLTFPLSIWISAETQVAHKFLHSHSDFITVSSFFFHLLCSPAIWASLPYEWKWKFIYILSCEFMVSGVWYLCKALSCRGNNRPPRMQSTNSERHKT